MRKHTKLSQFAKRLKGLGLVPVRRCPTCGKPETLYHCAVEGCYPGCED